MANTSLEADVVEAARRREKAQLTREVDQSARKTKVGIPKLDDAYKAGSKVVAEAQRCTLILTEGDSAKALAVAGLEILGYGV